MRCLAQPSCATGVASLAMSREIAHSHSWRRAEVVRCRARGWQLGLNALAQYSEQALPATDDYATRADMAYIHSRLDALVTSPATAGTTLS